jgi:hypothetical protein
MSYPLTMEIVEKEACEGCHLDLFMARGPHPTALYYCDECAIRLRDEIKRAMREWHAEVRLDD